MTSIRISTRQRKLIGSSSLIAILVLFIIVQRGCNSPKKTPVTPPLSGTFTVTGTPEPLVIAAIQDGEVKITNVETEENYDLELLDGEPRPLPLAPGSYRINNSGEVQFEFQNPEFTIVSGKTLTHPLFILLPFSWKHPKLPTIAGATATWKGELTRKPSNQPVVTADISTKSGSKKEKTATSKSPPGEDPRAAKIEPAVQRAVTFNYQLIMTTMNEDVVDDVKCRWLHVEVESFSSLNPMPVTEEAYLAVDVATWETGQSFKVRKGWFTVTSNDLRAELKLIPSLSGKSGEKDIQGRHDRLVFQFDPANPDHDPLPEIALALEAPLPEERLSLRDVLTLVMDANLPGSIPEAPKIRRNLVKLDVLLDREVRIHNKGQVNCLAVLSRIETYELQFKLLRNDAIIPFGLVFVDIKHPWLDASLELHSSFVPETTSKSETVNEVQLAMEAKRIGTLPEKPRFDLATIPEQDGAWSEYKGKIDLGPVKIGYVARIEALATVEPEGIPCRWLKLQIDSGPADGVFLHRETAIVLVDPAAYEASGEADILRGWLIYRDNKSKSDYVLDFDPEGDVTQNEEDLQMLQYNSAEQRLSAHDVLALLFNANLVQSPSRFSKLRPEVSEKLSASTERKMTRETKKWKGRQIPAKVWTFSGDAEFNYIFERCDSIPFSFMSMNLTFGAVKLVANLESSGTLPPQPFDETVWTTLADATQIAIQTWQDDNPNYRFWGNSSEGATRRILAEWAGEKKPTTTNGPIDTQFLKPWKQPADDLRVVKGKIEAERLAPLSKEDEAWIAEGRFWELQNYRAKYIPPKVKFTKNPEDVTLEVKGIEEIVPKDKLSDGDKDWVTNANLNWFTPR